jgi:hypothetical protein
MPAGRPRKYVTKDQAKAAKAALNKSYNAKVKHVNLPKEVVEEFVELRDELSYSNNYPFKLTNPQFFRVLIEAYRNNQK